MNNKLILWTITVGLGGLLFGLDVAVISGAEQAIQKLWHLSNLMHGTAIAMALYGTTIGAAFGNIPANKIGRKKTLIWIGIIFFISLESFKALWQNQSNNNTRISREMRTWMRMKMATLRLVPQRINAWL
jgi:MFS family permease